MSRNHPATPYRKGYAAGKAYWAARDQWQAAGGFKAGPAPTPPDNPYRPDQRRARTGWSVGVDTARRAVEREMREGKR